LNLNHSITGFDENGQLWGENGNCGTSYKVIEVPDSVTESDLERIGIAVNEACGNSFPVWYNAMRASNVDVVKKVISEMFEKINKSFWELPEDLQNAIKSVKLPDGWESQTTQGIAARKYMTSKEVGNLANSQIQEDRKNGISLINDSDYEMNDNEIYDLLNEFNKIISGCEIKKNVTALGKCIDIILPFSQWHSSNN
jgi:hypothetical protein